MKRNPEKKNMVGSAFKPDKEIKETKTKHFQKMDQPAGKIYREGYKQKK